MFARMDFSCRQAWELIPNKQGLLRWLNDPKVTGRLGWLGLHEVATQCDVELGRDYAMEQRDLVLRGSV